MKTGHYWASSWLKWAVLLHWNASNVTLRKYSYQTRLWKDRAPFIKTWERFLASERSAWKMGHEIIGQQNVYALCGSTVPYSDLLAVWGRATEKPQQTALWSRKRNEEPSTLTKYKHTTIQQKSHPHSRGWREQLDPAPNAEPQILIGIQGVKRVSLASKMSWSNASQMWKEL